MNLTHSAPTLSDALRGVWDWLRYHPKTRYLLVFLMVCTVCYFLNNGVAWADTESKPSAQTLFLPLDGITDTSGVPVWRYFELPMDPGNGGYVIRSVRYTIASILWAPYALGIILLLSLVDWLVSFQWLTWLAAPFETVADGVSGVLEAWMLIPIGISISAGWIGLGFLRGRTGAATVEFIMVCLVLAFVASPLTQPFDIMAGDGASADSSKGLIQRSGDIGAEAGAVTVNQDATTEDASLTGSIVDVTLRRPMLTMAFGSPLEDECAESWNTNAAEDSGFDAEDIRKEVIKCDDEVADANQTSSYMWMAPYILGHLSTAGVAAILAVFVVFLIWQVLQAFWSAIMTVVQGFIAAWPGNSRTAWLESLFKVIISSILVGVYIFALTIYMWLIGKIIDNLPPTMVEIGAVLMGIIVFIAAFTFWKIKRSGDSIGKRLSRALGRNGLSKNVQDRKPSKLGSVAGKAASIYQQSRMLKATRAGATMAAAATTGGVSTAATKAGSAVGKKMAGTAGKTMANKALPQPTKPSQVTGAPNTQQALPPAAPNTQQALPPAAPPAAELEPANAPLPPPNDDSGGTRALPQGQDHAGQAPVPSTMPEEPSQPEAKHIPDETEPVATNTAQTKPSGSSSTPQHVADTSHIPAGRYGNTWVHKGGQIHNPATIRPDGSPVQNVPSESKMNRAFRQGDSWVTSPDVQKLNSSSTSMRSS